jgi:hypothetical protein
MKVFGEKRCKAIYSWVEQERSFTRKHMKNKCVLSGNTEFYLQKLFYFKRYEAINTEK